MSMRVNRKYGSWRLAVALAAAVTVAACSSDDDDDDAGNGGGGGGGGDSTVALSTPLSPSEEVPPVTAEGASGTAEISVDTESGEVDGSVSVSGTTGPAQAAHIHQGFAGSNGGVLITLESADEGATWTVPVDAMLDAAGLTAFGNGELYVNVHTEANASGELRGQLLPPGVQLVRTTLSGEQEVPSVTTEASGEAVLTYVESSGLVDAAVFTTGLEDATAAHIHEGAAGENGDVLIELQQDTEIPGTWRTPEGTTLDTAGAAALAASGLYYNVHTPANPGGEIRGQIEPGDGDDG